MWFKNIVSKTKSEGNIFSPPECLYLLSNTPVFVSAVRCVSLQISVHCIDVIAIVSATLSILYNISLYI